LLQELEEAPCFKPLSGYLCGDGDFRCYELAWRIADHFDQYLVYRPDWITRWEAGEEEHWQAELWRRLAAGDSDHRVRLRERFFKTLANPARLARTKLPPRVCLIGIAAMPPVYLEILARLAGSIDIHLFLLNPCQEYWGDIVAERDIARQGIDIDAEELYLETGNSLLASLGKLGRDFIDMTQDCTGQLVEAFEAPPADSLLHCLQADILNLRNRDSEVFPPIPLKPDDRSVQVHACHSPRREVEVLYDQLLALFQANPDLQPADVVVMTPDIEAYGPTIEAVFSTVDGDRHIPFSIADRSPRAESPLVDTFFGLLELPDSRYDANRVLAVLETEAVQRRFGFTEEDLTRVHRWVRETGIRWGIDPDSRAELDLPATLEHTWQAGLDRLLLGYALPGDGARLMADILPFAEVEGDDAQIMGRLQAFAAAVFALKSQLAGRQSPAGWAGTLQTVLAQFLAPLEAHEAEVQLIRAALERLAANAEQAEFREPVSLTVIKSYLRRHMEVPEEGVGRFLSGGVTFCAMVPMRSIPFPVVCLIGMNHDSYPRPQRPLGFDLMARQFRRGDRSRRFDDRYLFLEALLSARCCLYLSYVGSSIRDNSVIPPSVLVSELLDVIDRGFLPAAAEEDQSVLEQLVTRHPLQAFSRRYFSGDTGLFSYSEPLCDASRLAGQDGKAPAPLIATGLPEPEAEWRTVELMQLIHFFANPARYLLRRRLGIHLKEDEGGLPCREPFILEPLAKQRLCQELLSLHLAGTPLTAALPVVRAAGVLPHGQVGECLFERERDTVERFAARLAQFLPTAKLEPLEIDLPFNGLRLTGWLPEVAPEGLVGYRLARVRPRDYLELWIRHLVLNRLAPPGVSLVSRWLGQDREIVLRPVTDAERHLQDLLDYYWQGLCQALHFFPKSAFAYVEAAGSAKTRTPPELAARRVWEGGEYQRGECQDLYYQLAFRGSDPLDAEFLRLSEAVFRPLVAHLKSEG
jgi:exodeoxyribonuclease V gamma subunit